MRYLLPAVCIIALFTASCSNRLAAYQDITLGAPANQSPLPKGKEVSVTYLGVNGYLIRSANTAIVVDPYFSRIPTRDILFRNPVQPDLGVLNFAARKAAFPRKVDGWLATHAHFDHLFDIPPLQKRFGGQIIASPTARYLCEAVGTSRRYLSPSLPGARHQIGDASIHVIPATHDKVFGRHPYPGLICEPMSEPPTLARDWKLGTPLAFLIEINGKRIYVESGGIRNSIPTVTDVDLAIVGVALPGSQNRYPIAIRALNPRYVIPSHQDNFFLPLNSGFHFSSLADFPRINAQHETMALPGKMFLMDYFATWTIPE